LILECERVRAMDRGAGAREGWKLGQPVDGVRRSNGHEGIVDRRPRVDNRCRDSIFQS
jgi:hypothetical protein